jgi:hypothetical protein
MARLALAHVAPGFLQMRLSPWHWHAINVPQALGEPFNLLQAEMISNQADSFLPSSKNDFGD